MDIAEVLASVRAEGLEPTPRGLELLEGVATGEVSVDAAIEALVRHHRVEGGPVSSGEFCSAPHDVGKSFSSTLVWEDPPTPKSRLLWLPEAEELRANPRKWARLPDRRSTISAQNMASAIRLGAISAFRPRGAFNARAHGKTVWVVYLGDGNLPGGQS